MAAGFGRRRLWGSLALVVVLCDAVARARAQGGASSEEPQVVTGWSGMFDDGSGDQATYSNNMNAWWLIDPCGKETRCKVLMWFSNFKTEESYDLLSVYDGDSTTSLIGEFSGSPSVDKILIRSRSNKLLIWFKSDAYRSFQGFTASFKADTQAMIGDMNLTTPIDPKFTSSVLQYQGGVVHETSIVNVSAAFLDGSQPQTPWTVSHPSGGAGFVVAEPRMTLNNQPYSAGSTMTVPLRAGINNVLEFQVVSTGQLNTMTYEVKIFRPADKESGLEYLAYSTGVTKPEFSASIMSYNTSVIYEIPTVVVTVKPVDPDVDNIWVGQRGTTGVKVQAIAGGRWQSDPVPIVPGVRDPIDVVVTAEDRLHKTTYVNFIERPRLSRSAFEREKLNAEWRRQQNFGPTIKDRFILNLGQGWDPCHNRTWTQYNKNKDSPLTCKGNSFELMVTDLSGVEHTLRGWYDVNTFLYPVKMTLDVLNATKKYAFLQGQRLQGHYRFTDWPTPPTDGLSTKSRTHVNFELDLAPCTAQQNGTVDTSIGADVIGADKIVAPESLGPFGATPWDCPMYSQVLGNDTSRFYIQVLRDVDECMDGSHGCSTNAVCTNTYGSRWCHCKAGYSGNPYFDACTDIDECAAATHNCGSHTLCTNNPGSWNCSCAIGYEGNPSVYAFDVDITTDGSIDVLKRPGHGWECVSVHENHTCQHVPTIYPQRLRSVRGGRRDTNANPARGDDQEPLWHFDDPPNPEYPDDSQHYYREKTDPAYIRALTESVPYPPPRWHFDGQPARDNECSDVNECETEAHECSTNGYCFNVPGSFSCFCHIGFAGDPYRKDGCVDVDECKEDKDGMEDKDGSHSCSYNSLCVNVPGTHLCNCPHDQSQLFWSGRVSGKPYNSKCHMPLRQSRMFVTRGRWTGEQVNTLAGADAKCESEGPELQPGFRWKAILSDRSSNARHHLSDGETSLLFPILRTDGKLVAVDDDQLWRGLILRNATLRGSKVYRGLANPINVDGSGTVIVVGAEWKGEHEVWTGSTINGSRFPNGDCWSWRENTVTTQNEEGGVQHLDTQLRQDLWQFGRHNSSASYGKIMGSVPGGVGGSYGDLRSTFAQWYAHRDTLQDCERRMRRLFCAEVHYSTRSVLRDPRVSPFGSRIKTSWFSASASSVLRPNDVFPAFAVDGDNVTFWQSSLHDSAAWIQIDMHAHHVVTAVSVEWQASCFPSAYSVMLSNNQSAVPSQPRSMFSAWEDPSGSENRSFYQDDHHWRIFHEVISRTHSADGLRSPSLLARQKSDMVLVKDPMASVTAVSPPEVARHIRIVVTDPNALLCHGVREIGVYSTEERPLGVYTEPARRTGPTYTSGTKRHVQEAPAAWCALLSPITTQRV